MKNKIKKQKIKLTHKFDITFTIDITFVIANVALVDSDNTLVVTNTTLSKKVYDTESAAYGCLGTIMSLAMASATI